MKESGKKLIYFILSFLFLAIGITGIIRARIRAELPFQWNAVKEKLIITDITDHSQAGNLLRSGDILLQVDGYTLGSNYELEFLVDGKKAGDIISLIISRNNINQVIDLEISRKWDNNFLLLNLILGLLIWTVGLIVYLKKNREYYSRVFYFLCMIVSTTIMMIWHGFPYSLTKTEYLLSVIYFILYPLLPLIVLYFFCIYPQKKSFLKSNRLLVFPFLLPAFFLMVLLQMTYFKAVHHFSLEIVKDFFQVLIGFRIYLFFYLIFSIICLAGSYKTSGNKINRYKLQWIIWGLTLGLAPFLLFWTIPIALINKPIIAEEVNFIFMMLIPISFAFSILKYKTFDIEIIINRSIVYFLITGLILIIYLAITAITSYSLRTFSPANLSIVFAIVSTLMIATFIYPLKTRIQNIVDKTFYRIKYDHRKALNKFRSNIFQIYDKKELLKSFSDSLQQYIPVKNIIIFREGESEPDLKYYFSREAVPEQLKKLIFPVRNEMIKLLKTSNLPVARSGRAEISEKLDLELFQDLSGFGIELMLPILIESEVKYLILLGGKLSEGRFLEEDVALITAIASESCIMLERLDLLEKIILERTEIERLEKLNTLKSEFVSHVSHELRTPLTSISWSVENLLEGIPQKPAPPVVEYLKGIHESSEHLNRMIENLLDISKIEAGRIEFRKKELSLCEAIESTLKILQQPAEKKGLSFKLECDPELIFKTDPDHLHDILINLIENAVKYTYESDTIRISGELSKDNNDNVTVSVIDHGPGIDEAKIKRIFDKFERLSEDRSIRTKGLGLGLHIVKKLVELQGGKIWVESSSGKGCKISFQLPMNTDPESIVVKKR